MSEENAEFSVSPSESVQDVTIDEEYEAAKAEEAAKLEAAEEAAKQDAADAKNKAEDEAEAAAAKRRQFPDHVYQFNASACEIHSIRPYQAVTFDGKQMTYFSSEEINGKPNHHIELIPTLNMVYIASKTDEALVPFTNISAIHLMSTRRKEQTAKNIAARSTLPTARGADVRRPR